MKKTVISVPVRVKAAPEDVSVRGAFIRLDDLLKFAGAAGTGGEAKAAVQGGDVRVNGETCLVRGKKLFDGDVAEYRGKRYRVKAGE